MAKKATKKAPQGRPPVDGTCLPCKFSNYGGGPERIAIGVKIDRHKIDQKELDELVCGARLDVTLVYDPASPKEGDVVGQTKLMRTAEVELTSVADCPSLSLRPKEYGFRLSFSADDQRVIKKITLLAQQAGKITMKRIGDSGDSTAGGDADDDDE